MNIELLVKQTQAKWGTVAQLDMVVEECSELINAIQKWKRGRVERIEVVEEGVDVEIMVEQLKVIVELPTLWEHIREDKLERLTKLLNGV